jgi:4-aminobutyrate aminotransferase-like enzyme
LRLARAYTGQRDLIVSEGAYHGHTSTLIDISPYKAEGAGGAGLPPWVHKADVPDLYRGKYRRDNPNAGLHYAQDVQRIIDGIHAQDRGLCGFIIESVPSVGGQIVLPDGYLPAVYASVRAAGGVCIADEVQTGFGRLGSHFWAFERYGVVPDIVALGKPIGNGYPMGAVITTPAIANAFDNGMEFFSTFGGSTVACAVGNAVLDVIEQEDLQAHALEVGDAFASKLCEVMARHSIIGDVRGGGLMLGLELVNDRETLAPAAKQASYIANRMQQRGVLIGTDGIHHNILKIRGPMCLTHDDVDVFVRELDAVLEEDGAQPVGMFEGTGVS